MVTVCIRQNKLGFGNCISTEVLQGIMAISYLSLATFAWLHLLLQMTSVVLIFCQSIFDYFCRTVNIPYDMNELPSPPMTWFPSVSGRPLPLHHGCLASILIMPYFTHRMVKCFGTYHTLICSSKQTCKNTEQFESMETYGKRYLGFCII